jgi:hypothetical protein
VIGTRGYQFQLDRIERLASCNPVVPPGRITLAGDGGDIGEVASRQVVNTAKNGPSMSEPLVFVTSFSTNRSVAGL